MITDAWFDRYFFGPHRDATTARSLLESRLKLRINTIHQLHHITKDERKKLELAGRGDIKRFFDRVEEARERFQRAAKVGIPLHQAVEDLGALRNHFETGLFDEGSLSDKTLKTILRRKQWSQADRHAAVQRISRYQSRVAWVVLTLQKSLSLSDDQRQRLLNLLLEETRLPRSFGPFDYFGIVFQASELPEAKLKPIFDDAQWRLLRREFDIARRLEGMLKDQGYLPEDRPAGPRSAAAEVGKDRESLGGRADGQEPRGAARPRLN
jgi:hypothetical protein